MTGGCCRPVAAVVDRYQAVDGAAVKGNCCRQVAVLDKWLLQTGGCCRQVADVWRVVTTVQ